MAKIKYDINLMKFISLFESITRAKVKDCFEEGEKLVFVVYPNEMGKAIGKQEVNVKKLSGILKKQLKIVEFDDSHFDVVYTMAVLMHIHPDSEFIFKEITRITKDRLIVIEDEKCISPRHFPRNYKSVFENLGMRQIYFNDKVPGSSGFCRIFIHSNFI